MELTTSYNAAIPAEVHARYEFCEVRNAAALLATVAPVEYADVVEVLQGFRLQADALTTPGGNKTSIALDLDTAFRIRGWREGRHDLEISSTVSYMPYRPAGERTARRETTIETAGGYKVDNLKGRVALDVEWNAKDGNLHRDLTAYRVFYEQGLIDVAVLVTRTRADMEHLAEVLGRPGWGGSTTTNIDKLTPLLARGSAGGCPVLAVAITARCYAP